MTASYRAFKCVKHFLKKMEMKDDFYFLEQSSSEIVCQSLGTKRKTKQNNKTKNNQPTKPKPPPLKEKQNTLLFTCCL